MDTDAYGEGHMGTTALVGGEVQALRVGPERRNNSTTISRNVMKFIHEQLWVSWDPRNTLEWGRRVCLVKDPSSVKASETLATDSFTKPQFKKLFTCVLLGTT